MVGGSDCWRTSRCCLSVVYRLRVRALARDPLSPLTSLHGPRRDLMASLQAELPEDSRDLLADGQPLQAEPIRDRLIRHPLRYEGDDLPLALGQRRARSASNGT